ncbi:type IV secretion protein Dot [Legionella sp. PATHC032]|uniref:type IV secretion protein Dot n=1 Tax=Legionella sp. PATHC032 TaxID=2992039 RepID=UPI001B0CA67F|nr:type IV secretion protein Dot [Legionella sp. PATHC032]MCW8420249.1 type IV secretion protein Dot [Legionella sp. PATHC032]HAZ7573010.1 type IV secretion protein Dot [Legionella pneumophila]HBA1635991.1 type IV secretion protein Dot [Legionella pneumophila]
MSYSIDNPGGGDCGFYALAVGLINIIQNEYKLHGKSKTYDRWKQVEGIYGIRMQDILNVDLKKLHDSPYTYKSELLFLLQMSLRNIAVIVNKEDLVKRIIEEGRSKDQTKIEGSNAYCKFMELVQLYLYRRGSLEMISQFNELALSPEIVQTAQDIARMLRPILRNQPFHQAQKIENAFVKEVLLNDVLSGNAINSNSIILKSLEKIKERGRWATHDDLKEIAELLKINLNVVGQPNGKPIPGHPTVNLINHYNTHWTTQIESLHGPRQYSVPRKGAFGYETVSGRAVSLKEEQIVDRTFRTQTESDRAKRYNQHFETLFDTLSPYGFFPHAQNKRNVHVFGKAQTGLESDEALAVQLQEAELRRLVF